MNRWLDQLSNWQYVAFMASVFILSLVIAGCVLGLISGFADLRGFFTVGAYPQGSAAGYQAMDGSAHANEMPRRWAQFRGQAD